MHKNLLIALALLVLLVGGGYYLWQNQVATPEPVTEVEDNEYHSAQYGISFSYPDTYAMTEHDEGTAERMVHSVVLMDKAVVNEHATEGPPTITVSIFENPENLTLENWVKTVSYSNFSLSSDGKLTSTTVGGQPALSYSHTGLYENDAVVTMHNGRVYMFTVGWLTTTDQTRTDAKEILGTVEFVAS